jgi:hypothetical protein
MCRLLPAAECAQADKGPLLQLVLAPAVGRTCRQRLSCGQLATQHHVHWHVCSPLQVCCERVQSDGHCQHLATLQLLSLLLPSAPLLREFLRVGACAAAGELWSDWVWLSSDMRMPPAREQNSPSVLLLACRPPQHASHTCQRGAQVRCRPAAGQGSRKSARCPVPGRMPPNHASIIPDRAIPVPPEAGRKALPMFVPFSRLAVAARRCLSATGDLIVMLDNN